MASAPRSTHVRTCSPDIAVRILFISQSPDYPENPAGGRINADRLCIRLRDRGVQFALLSLGEIVSAAPYVLDYPAYMRPDTPGSIREVIAQFQPELAMLQCCRCFDVADTCLSINLPTLAYLHDTEFNWLFHQGSGPRSIDLAHPLLAYIANSSYTARRLRDVLGIDASVLPPFIEPERYRTETTRQSVVFVNPVPEKGVARAIRLAESRPDIEFEFVESWKLHSPYVDNLRAMLRLLPNVKLSAPVSDMREVYGRAKVLLAPSRWAEAWGRVVSEAQVNGIPALVSDRGGLPEALGPGGLAVDEDAGDESWSNALARIWDDPSEYQRLADAAFAHAARPDFQPDALLDRFIAIASSHAGTHAP
ncbi:MAG TPA: glycosyltransferase [Candidatus Cybelea sp.]|nr:glycosyltransferase [Candidatus Cybelea sp.]